LKAVFACDETTFGLRAFETCMLRVGHDYQDE
jgi:hypothetical protein